MSSGFLLPRLLFYTVSAPVVQKTRQRQALQCLVGSFSVAGTALVRTIIIQQPFKYFKWLFITTKQDGGSYRRPVFKEIYARRCVCLSSHIIYRYALAASQQLHSVSIITCSSNAAEITPLCLNLLPALLNGNAFSYAADYLLAVRTAEVHV